jgi:hypothetical protein
MLLRGWLALFHVAPREELLKTLEAGLDRSCAPVLLPGRYAFLLSCGAENIRNSRGWSVAVGSQR